MTTKKLMTSVLGLAALLCVSAAQAGNTTTHGDTMTQGMVNAGVQFVDLLWLKPGINPQAAAHYFNELLPPILEKHGGKVIFVYAVETAIKGELKPAITASMTFPSMDSLKEVFSDPEYAKIVPVRDATFDFTQQSLLKVRPL